MKLKQKPEDKQDNQEGEVDITQLTGSPEPQGVSKVAMGEKSKTLMEHDDVENTEWIERLKGGGEDDADLCEIEESYAKLFEGLAGIMRYKS